MSGIEDTATVTLNVNGVQAKQMMADLKAKIKQTETTIENLKRSMADPKDIEKAKRQLKAYRKQLDEMKSATEGVDRALSNMDFATPRQLEKALRTLNKQLKDMEPGSEIWDSHIAKIQELKGRLAELKGEINGQESAWNRFMEWSQGAWPALDLIKGWSNNLVSALRDYVNAFAEMDQEMANVRKFTGMAEADVKELNEEFKNIDTRTSRENLNKLAQEAGRLGKTSKEDVLGFVRAADKINVALDDLGDGATLKLSKLTGIFGDDARYGTEQSLLKVGSVINELSQNCSASAPYLADFASRLGGVGSQAGMTISQIMGFGAVLDSAGQQVEASATAVSQIIVRMMQDPAKYARVAGLDVKKFADMLKTDVNGAFILFLETLQKAGGMDVLSPMFKDMGENGARAVASLATLAKHIDEVKAQQRAANKAFREGTSVTNEFQVQNSTVQAGLDKAKKAFQEVRIELGDKLSPLMAHLITGTSAMTRALAVLVEFVSEHKLFLLSLTAGIVAYTVAVNLAAIKTTLLATGSKVLALAMSTTRLASLAFAVVISTLSGNITRASAAFKLFSLAIKANPIGLAVSLITTAVTAIGGWIYKVNEAKKAERELAEQRAKQAHDYRAQVLDISRQSSDYAKGELDRLKKLYNATQDTTKSQRERLAAVTDLQKTYPTTFSNFSKEQIMAGEASAAYRKLAKDIIKVARAKAAAEKIKENEKELLDLEMAQEDISEQMNTDAAALEAAKQKRREISSKISREHRNDFYVPANEQAKLDDARSAVSALEKNLDSSAEKLDEVFMKQGVLQEANKRLAKKAALSSGVSTDALGLMDETPNVVAPTGGGYTPQAFSDEDVRKKAAEAEREAAKASEGFKAQLNAYKAQKQASDTEVLELYRAGSIEYEELMRRRHDNELKYYDDSLAHYEETFKEQKETYLQDDKDYQKLLLDKEKSEEKFERNRIALALETIRRRQDVEERDAQHEYSVRSNPSVSDEISLQARLFSIRKKALEDQQELYEVGTKEYADISYQIEHLVNENELNQKKIYFKAVAALRAEYDKKSAAERFALEKAGLDALLKAEILTLEQYKKYLDGLTGKYKSQLPGAPEQSWTEKDEETYKDNIKELEDALNEGLISQQDFNDRSNKLASDKRRKQLEGLKGTAGEWRNYLIDIYGSLADFIDSLDGSMANTLGKLAGLVGAVTSAVGAGMQIASEFARAESEIQQKAVERRYDREIELAQGNSYKVAKAEKKKEDELQKIKAQAAKKEFAVKVFMAIGQTAQNALMGYAAGLQYPFPLNTVMPAVLAGLAVAQGAVQVALIKKQQQASAAQGYSKGGFTKPGGVNEPAGIVHAGEWIASQKLLSSPVARPMIEALDYAQRTNTIGSLRAEDVSRSITANNSLVRIAESDNGSLVMAAVASQMSTAVAGLTDRLNKPFVTVNTVTGDRGIKQAQDEYTRLMNNVTPKSKRK